MPLAIIIILLPGANSAATPTRILLFYAAYYLRYTLLILVVIGLHTCHACLARHHTSPRAYMSPPERLYWVVNNTITCCLPLATTAYKNTEEREYSIIGLPGFTIADAGAIYATAIFAGLRSYYALRLVIGWFIYHCYIVAAAVVLMFAVIYATPSSVRYVAGCLSSQPLPSLASRSLTPSFQEADHYYTTLPAAGILEYGRGRQRTGLAQSRWLPVTGHHCFAQPLYHTHIIIMGASACRRYLNIGRHCWLRCHSLPRHYTPVSATAAYYHHHTWLPYSCCRHTSLHAAATTTYRQWNHRLTARRRHHTPLGENSKYFTTLPVVTPIVEWPYCGAHQGPEYVIIITHCHHEIVNTHAVAILAGNANAWRSPEMGFAAMP